jgi:hypothetical protein
MDSRLRGNDVSAGARALFKCLHYQAQREECLYYVWDSHSWLSSKALTVTYTSGWTRDPAIELLAILKREADRRVGFQPFSPRSGRNHVAHGASRGLGRLPSPPVPSPARAGEGCRRRGEGRRSHGWRRGLHDSARSAGLSCLKRAGAEGRSGEQAAFRTESTDRMHPPCPAEDVGHDQSKARGVASLRNVEAQGGGERPPLQQTKTFPLDDLV